LDEVLDPEGFPGGDGNRANGFWREFLQRAATVAVARAITHRRCMWRAFFRHHRTNSPLRHAAAISEPSSPTPSILLGRKKTPQFYLEGLFLSTNPTLLGARHKSGNFPKSPKTRQRPSVPATPDDSACIPSRPTTHGRSVVERAGVPLAAHFDAVIRRSQGRRRILPPEQKAGRSDRPGRTTNPLDSVRAFVEDSITPPNPERFR
jgi:hypothetical protein